MHLDGERMDLVTILTVVVVIETVIMIVEPFIMRRLQKSDNKSDRFEDKFQKFEDIERRLFTAESKLDSLTFLIQWVRKVGEDKAIAVFESQRMVQKWR